MKYAREVDVDKLKQVEEFVSSKEVLTTSVKDMGYKMTGNTMSCPFHGSDSTPSLKINGNKWKCFGCGRGGGYLKFMHENALLENSKVTYYDVVESYVQSNAEVASLIDGTIYKTNELSFSEQWEEALEIAELKTYKPKRIEVRSLDKLIRKVKKEPTSIKMQLLSGIQDDLPYAVLESIVNGTDLTGKTLAEIAMLLD